MRSSYLAFVALHALFALTLVVAFVALLVLLAPLHFVCSAHGHPPLCAVIGSLDFGLLDHSGQWYGSTLLGYMNLPATLPTADGMSVSNTQSAFQALFGFSVALGLVTYTWGTCSKALRNLPGELEVAITSTSDMLFGDESLALFRQRMNRWRPRHAFIIHVTILLVYVSYTLTAFVSGNLLILPTMTTSQKLGFAWPPTVTFLLSPFIASLLLLMDLLITKTLLKRSLAFEYCWRRIGIGWEESRSLLRNRLASTEESRRVSARAYLNFAGEIMGKTWRWIRNPFHPS